jgi:thiol:disulfide interchange protein DsbD
MRMRALILAACLAAAGQALAGPAQPVQASLEALASAYQPGQALRVSLRLRHQPGWHSYYKDPGDAGLPTTLAWALPAGVSAGAIQWPAPERFTAPGGLACQGYTGDLSLPVVLKVAAGFRQPLLHLAAHASWLACSQVCIPGGADLSLDLPLAGTGAQGLAAPSEAPAEPAWASLARMLLLAFLGGMLLNLMPCVLPVLSLKVFGLMGQGGAKPANGLAYTLGVLASFWGLGAAVLVLKAAGASVGWGFQMQNPWYVAGMALLLTGFSLNLFGLFEVGAPSRALQGMAKASTGEGPASAFFSGAFATLLATPCTAPLLGSAVGFAFTQPALVLLSALTAVGLGLALPFAVASSVPVLARWLPKPGAWMLRLRQGLGFLLLAFLPWLLWVLGRLTSLEASMRAAAACLGLAFFIWLAAGLGRRLAWLLCLLAALGLFVALMAPALSRPAASPAAEARDGWLPWSEAGLAALRAQDRTVFVDATADWCWTCKVNERAILASSKVRDAFASSQAVLMRADWTRQDPAITALLARFGRAGVPFYVVYPGKGEPRPLPEIPSAQQVADALRR